MGYALAWSPEGVNGEREEKCVGEPNGRVGIVDIILGHIGQAQRAGYVVGGRLNQVKRKRTD